MKEFSAQIVERLPMAVIVVHAQTGRPEDLKLVFANSRVHEETGIDPAPLLGRTIGETMPAVLDLPTEFSWPAAWLRVAETEVAESYEAFPLDVEGFNFALFRTQIEPLGDRHVAVYLTNIGRHVPSEQELSDRKIRDIINLSADAVFSLDRDWRFVFLNRTAAKAFRMDPSKLLGKNIWEVFPHFKGSPFKKRCYRTMKMKIAELFETTEPFHGDWYEIQMFPTSDGISVSARNISERRLQEQQREQSRDHLNALFEATMRIMAESNPQPVLDHLCNTALQVTGAKAVLAGCKLKDNRFRYFAFASDDQNVPPLETRQACLARFFSVKMKNKSFYWGVGFNGDEPICAFRKKQGLPPISDLMAVTFDNEEGKRAGLLLVVRDDGSRFGEEEQVMIRQISAVVSLALQNIAARDAIEKRARETEEGHAILDALMEHIPIGLSISDGKANHLRYISRYSLELTGHNRDQLLASKSTGPNEREVFLHPDSGNPATGEELPLVRAVRNGETVIAEEWQLASPENRRIPILCNAAPIRNRDGEIIAGVVAWSDISTIKAYEKKIEKNAEELEERVNKRTKQLLNANKALQASEQRMQSVLRSAPLIMWTTDREGKVTMAVGTGLRMLGYEPLQLIGLDLINHPEIPPKLVYATSEALTGRQHNTVIMVPSGEYYDTHTAPLFEVGGGIDGTTGVALNITLRKIAQQRLAALASSLEQKNRQLRNLTFELVQAEQKERRRLSQVLHDHLQQILAASKIKLSIAGQISTDPQVVEECRAVSEMLAEAIHSSRSLAIELSPPILRSSDLDQILHWLANHLQQMHNLQVNVIYTGDTVRFGPDVSALIYHSLKELMFNIVKHAATNEAVLEAVVDENTVRLTVKDDGSGFNVTDLEKNETPGFGLFTIGERLLYLGGRLAIESTPGEGTKINLILPRSIVIKEKFVDFNDQQQVDAEPETDDDSRIRVLIADDHHLLRKGLLDLLGENQQIEVVGEAWNGQMAVELAENLRPHVVLMDITMPVISGIEATRLIRRRLPHTRIIALSMHNESEFRNAMIDAGAEAFFEKGGPSGILLEAILHPANREIGKS